MRSACVLGLHREAAAMPAGDAALVAVAERRARHIGQRGGARIVGLVDMQVDVEVVARGEREQPVEQRVEIVERRAVGAGVGRARHRAEDAAGLRHQRGELVAAFVAEEIDRDQRHRLQRDRGPAIPRACRGTRASFARPARAPNRDACGSPRRRARRRSAGRSSMRAMQVLVGPAQPVGLRGGQRIGERAADIGRAHHRVAAVEMGVHVDQHRPDLAAAQIDGACVVGRARRPARCARPCRSRSADRAAPTPSSRSCGANACGLASRRQRHARIADPVGGGVGPDDVGEMRQHRRHALTLAAPAPRAAATGRTPSCRAAAR